MNKILAIIRKDIRLRFAGPSEWLFFLILPVVFTLILAGGTGGGGRRAHPAGGRGPGQHAALGRADRRAGQVGGHPASKWCRWRQAESEFSQRSASRRC